MQIQQMTIELGEPVNIPLGWHILAFNYDPERPDVLDISALTDSDTLQRAKFAFVKDIWVHRELSADWFVAHVQGDEALIGSYKVCETSDSSSTEKT